MRERLEALDLVLRRRADAARAAEEDPDLPDPHAGARVERLADDDVVVPVAVHVARARDRRAEARSGLAGGELALERERSVGAAEIDVDLAAAGRGRNADHDVAIAVAVHIPGGGDDRSVHGIGGEGRSGNEAQQDGQGEAADGQAVVGHHWVLRTMGSVSLY